MTGLSCGRLQVVEIHLEKKGKLEIYFRKVRKTPEHFIIINFCLKSPLLNGFVLAC